MNRSRLFLLTIVTALLIASPTLKSSADQLQSAASLQEFSIFGNVKIRGTPSGHITVAVDKSAPLAGLQADGRWDIVFHFVPKKANPANQTISLDSEGAIVVSTGRRLTVISDERRVLLNLTLEKETQNDGWTHYYNDRSRDLAETVRISRGLALGQYEASEESVEGFWMCGSEGGKCSFRARAGDIRAMDIAPIEPAECPSGGAGASSCSISCGPGQGCSVSCGSGTYACCHCSNGCHCIR